MNSVIIFQDGSWEYEDLAAVKMETSGLKNIRIKIGDNWLDSEISRMVKDYFTENVEYLFE